MDSIVQKEKIVRCASLAEEAVGGRAQVLGSPLTSRLRIMPIVSRDRQDADALKILQAAAELGHCMFALLNLGNRCRTVVLHVFGTCGHVLQHCGTRILIDWPVGTILGDGTKTALDSSGVRGQEDTIGF